MEFRISSICLRPKELFSFFSLKTKASLSKLRLSCLVEVRALHAVSRKILAMSSYRCLSCFLFLLLSAPCFAGLVCDDSSNYGAWTGDGGTGFGAWSFNTSGISTTFMGYTSDGNDSTANGDGDSNGDGDVNVSTFGGTNNSAFGLYSNDGIAEAFRGFDSPLASGDVFRIRMDNGFLENGGAQGIELRDSSGGVLEFLFRGGQSNYEIGIGGSFTSASVPFTDEGLDLAFTITGATTFDLTVTPLDSSLLGGTTTSVTTSGTHSGGPISGLRLFSFDPTGDGVTKNDDFNLYFNSLSVSAVPEPSSLLCIFTVFSMMLFTKIPMVQRFFNTGV